METAYIALGGNSGPVLQHFVAAIAGLKAAGQRVEAISRAYRTVAEVLPGAAADADYWNAACTVRTALDAADLLRCLQRLESAAGRVRTRRWGPRPLDLDLLLYGQETAHTEILTLPHPALRQRVFVLRPLCDVAPRVQVPPDGATATALLDALPDSSAGLLEARSRWYLAEQAIAI